MTILAIDIGSEFVDIAVQTSSGCQIRKVAKDSGAEIEATLAAIETTLAAWSIRFEDIETVRVGSTTAINALLARTGDRIALLTTEGFGDCLWLGRQNWADLYDPVARSPAPSFLVERENAFEISGRMDAAVGGKSRRSTKPQSGLSPM